MTDPAQPVPPDGAGAPIPPGQPAYPIPPGQPAYPIPPGQPAYPIPPGQPDYPTPPSPWADPNAPIVAPAPQPFYGAPAGQDPPAIVWAPQLATGYLPPPPRRGRRRAIVIAAVAVVVLLLSGGAYAGLRAWYGWDSAEPESAVPAGVLAFARLDLNPGYSQQVKLASLLSKFPKPDTGTQTSRIEHELLGSLDLNFATDVQPWFAERIGYAAWLGSGGRPIMLVALASKDDGKAADALAQAQTRRGRDRLGYTVRDGYALLAVAGKNAQGEAEAARAATQKESLAGSARFSGAMARLDGAHLALVYVDLTAAGTAANGALADVVRAPALTGSGAAPEFTKLTGTFAVTADAAGNGVEVRFAATGLASTGVAGTDAKAALDTLPAASVIAGTTAGLDPNDSATSSLTELLNGPLFDTSDDDGPTPAQAKELTGGLMAFLTARTISFAFTNLGPGQPAGIVSADARDTAAANQLKAAVRQLLQDSPKSGVTVDQQGTTVRIQIGKPDTSGQLADRALYREAMAGMPYRPGTAFYADVQQLVATDQAVPEQVRRQWAPVKAVGFAASRRGSNADGLLRIVIK